MNEQHQSLSVHLFANETFCDQASLDMSGPDSLN
jgi:hypothetical protein